MQKVLVLPVLTTKQHLFVSRLIVFNETFASKTADVPEFIMLWHEGIRGRTATDVASTYIKLLSCNNYDHVIICPCNKKVQ